MSWANNFCMSKEDYELLSDWYSLKVIGKESSMGKTIESYEIRAEE